MIRKKHIIMLILLLTFFSGAFTLGRLSIDFLNYEVKYLLMVFFVLSVLWQRSSQDFSLMFKNDKPFFLFNTSIFAYFFISLLSIFNSNDMLFSMTKFTDIIFLMFLILGLMYVVPAFDRQEFFHFLSGFLIVIGTIYLLPVFFEVLAGASRGNFSLGGPNVTTRVFFFSACASLYRFTFSEQLKYFLLFIAFLIGIVFVGSRGGMIAAICTLAFLGFVKYFLRPWRVKKRRNLRLPIKKVLYFIIGIGLVLTMIDPIMRVFQSRIIQLMFNRGDQGIYTAGRNILYEQAKTMIVEKPIFGHGLEAFTIRYGGIYPHNLLLEMMIDIGTIGAVFFVAMCVFAIYIIFKLRKTKLFIFSGLPLYMIMVQMVSGGLYDFRYYFFWMIILLYYMAKRTIIKESFMIKKLN